MKINNENSDDAVLVELGVRLARERLQQGKTQAQLASTSGVSKRTIERIERGHSAQLGSVICLLRALSLLDRLEQIVPINELPPTGFSLSSLTERKRASSKRVRKTGKVKTDTKTVATSTDPQEPGLQPRVVLNNVYNRQ